MTYKYSYPDTPSDEFATYVSNMAELEIVYTLYPRIKVTAMLMLKLTYHLCLRQISAKKQQKK